MNPLKRIPLRPTGAIALAAVIGSVALAKLTSGGHRQPELATPLAFMVLFLATITLLAVAIVSCQRLVDEMDAAHPLKVRNRGALWRLVKRSYRRSLGLIGRTSRAVVRWVSATIVVLRREATRSYRFAVRGIVRTSRVVVRWVSTTIVMFRREVTRTHRFTARVVGHCSAAVLRWVFAARRTLRRELTRDALQRRGRAASFALYGVPPDDATPPNAGRLARPAPSHRRPRPLPRPQHRRSRWSGSPRSSALSALARLTEQASKREQPAAPDAAR
jgi:hypothetical protein